MDYTVIKELAKFQDVLFKEDTHSYIVGNKNLTSVTTFIKRFESKKDWDEIAKKYAKKHGLKKEEVQDLWKEEGRISGIRGTAMHKHIEDAINCRIYPDNEGVIPHELKQQFNTFWDKAKKTLIPVRSEFIVYDESISLAGTIDQLFWNTKYNELQIWDWKTNKKIDVSNRYNNLTGIFSDLDECEFTKYSIQLQIYKYIIENNTNLKVGDCYICHFQEKNDTFGIYKTLDLQEKLDSHFYF